MGVLEQIMDLKRRGTPDNEIVNTLREEGISPREINDALNQAKIKKAVSSEGSNKSGMEPSILGPEGAEPPPKELPTAGRISDADITPVAPYPRTSSLKKAPVSMDISEQEHVPKPAGESYSNQEQQYPQSPQYRTEEYSDSQQPSYSTGEYSPQEYYPQQEYGYPMTGISDTDTLIEISEQVFFEKIKPIKKQIEDLNEFKVLAQTKIENISNRLKRIESNIDQLQSEILEKVGSYGRGLENVKKEMGMVQDSFGKIVNTLADKTEEKSRKHVSKKTSPYKKAHPKRKKPSKSKKSSKKKK